MAPDSRDAGGDGAVGGPVGGPEPALRGGGLPLPGLKHWRLRKGMSQAELARRAEPEGRLRRQGRVGEAGVHDLTLSIIWVLSLALFALRQVRFWAKKRPLAISIAAWLLYVALVYLRTVP